MNKMILIFAGDLSGFGRRPNGNHAAVDDV